MLPKTLTLIVFSLKSKSEVSMAKKWAVAFEYDLKEGLCILARKDAGSGEVALFDSKENAEEWVALSGEIDAELWDINYVKFND